MAPSCNMHLEAATIRERVRPRRREMEMTEAITMRPTARKRSNPESSM